MKHPLLRVSLLMCLFLASCASRSVRAQDSKPEFRVAVKNAEDKVSVLEENSQTVIDIQSETGIGTAAFELVAGTMPETLLLRLHLRGLEEFRIISSQTALGASVASSEAGLPVERIVLSALELPILPAHPLWMDIQTVSESSHIPLDDGHFEIKIPREFLRNAGTSFEVCWIDFYR